MYQIEIDIDSIGEAAVGRRPTDEEYLEIAEMAARFLGAEGIDLDDDGTITLSGEEPEDIDEQIRRWWQFDAGAVEAIFRRGEE